MLLMTCVQEKEHFEREEKCVEKQVVVLSTARWTHVNPNYCWFKYTPTVAFYALFPLRPVGCHLITVHVCVFTPLSLVL